MRRDLVVALCFFFTIVALLFTPSYLIAVIRLERIIIGQDCDYHHLMSDDSSILLIKNVISTTMYITSYLQFGTRLPTKLKIFLLWVTSYEIASVTRTFRIRTIQLFSYPSISTHLNETQFDNNSVLPITFYSYFTFETWIPTMCSPIITTHQRFQQSHLNATSSQSKPDCLEYYRWRRNRGNLLQLPLDDHRKQRKYHSPYHLPKVDLHLWFLDTCENSPTREF